VSSIPTIISGLATLVVYGLIVASVYKVFQMSSDLTEVKELLKDIRRNTEVATPVTQSTENLMRAVHGESYHPPAPVDQDVV
jgi:hypothetical protein